MTIAPNIIDPAEERVRLAGALAAAAADLQRLVERDKAAEARASDVEEAAAPGATWTRSATRTRARGTWRSRWPATPPRTIG